LDIEPLIFLSFGGSKKMQELLPLMVDWPHNNLLMSETFPCISVRRASMSTAQLVSPSTELLPIMNFGVLENWCEVEGLKQVCAAVVLNGGLFGVEETGNMLGFGQRSGDMDENSRSHEPFFFLMENVLNVKCNRHILLEEDPLQSTMDWRVSS
jgi:hypothetical protein